MSSLTSEFCSVTTDDLTAISREVTEKFVEDMDSLSLSAANFQKHFPVFRGLMTFATGEGVLKAIEGGPAGQPTVLSVQFSQVKILREFELYPVSYRPKIRLGDKCLLPAPGARNEK